MQHEENPSDVGDAISLQRSESYVETDAGKGGEYLQSSVDLTAGYG